jgi:UDP-N-acetylglucosamine 2-epimerase (hydrolysing)
LKKVVFLTGSRADYGKLKPLMLAVDACEDMQCYVFVSGMHLLNKYGATFNDILADCYKNVYIPKIQRIIDRMDINLATTIPVFSDYIHDIQPQVIVVHGDRLEALAGAIVAMFNNILLAHIEGGEITGTVDESMRHAISKMANIHFVSSAESRLRLIQLGESKNNIHVIGSPDIDIMLSNNLPELNQVIKEYDIYFDNYALLIYHPVTTEIAKLQSNVEALTKAIIRSEKNFIAIYPNNDHGSDAIISALKQLENKQRLKVFKSLPFEIFLTLLKNCDFIMGNSSAGIREACVYGVPAIDIGTRQHNRYLMHLLPNIMHADEQDVDAILRCISRANNHRVASSYFGEGKSSVQFIDILRSPQILNCTTQKSFVDNDITQKEIQNYINEVCF